MTPKWGLGPAEWGEGPQVTLGVSIVMVGGCGGPQNEGWDPQNGSWDPQVTLGVSIGMVGGCGDRGGPQNGGWDPQNGGWDPQKRHWGSQ